MRRLASNLSVENTERKMMRQGKTTNKTYTVLLGFMATYTMVELGSERNTGVGEMGDHMRQNATHKKTDIRPHTWFFAASPMSRSVSVKATYEGVVRFPCSFLLMASKTIL